MQQMKNNKNPEHHLTTHDHGRAGQTVIIQVGEGVGINRENVIVCSSVHELFSAGREQTGCKGGDPTPLHSPPVRNQTAGVKGAKWHKIT